MYYWNKNYGNGKCKQPRWWNDIINSFIKRKIIKAWEVKKIKERKYILRERERDKEWKIWMKNLGNDPKRLLKKRD